MALTHYVFLPLWCLIFINFQIVKNDAAVLTSDCDETLAFAEYHDHYQNACIHPLDFSDVTVVIESLL